MNHYVESIFKINSLQNILNFKSLRMDEVLVYKV